MVGPALDNRIIEVPPPQRYPSGTDTEQTNFSTMLRPPFLPLLRPVVLAVSVFALTALQASVPRQVIVDHSVLNARPPEEQARVLDLQCRLETLLATDKSTLGREERKALRSDYRAMKEEMDLLNRDGTAIYLSTGAIIIILLLILIL